MSFMLDFGPEEDNLEDEGDYDPMWAWIVIYALVVVIAVGIWLL